MTTHLVHTSAELKTAFNAANDGDRIELATGGVFDDVTLSGRDFGTELVITSEDQTNLTEIAGQIEFLYTSNITIENLEFRQTGLPTDGSLGALMVRKSSDITLRNLELQGHIPTEAEGLDPLDSNASRGSIITGYGYGTGLRIKGTSNVTVENVEIHDFRIAARLEGSDNLNITGIDIHDVREGINLFDLDDSVIEDSHFHDFNPWWFGDASVHDHPDMIQYWGVGSDSGIHNLTIQNNLFDQDDGWTQTIYGKMTGAPDGVTAENFQILNNVIINGHQNAIRLHNVDGAVIDNNLLLPNIADTTDNARYPRIILVNSTDVDITGNVIPVMTNGDITADDAGTVASLGLRYDDNALLSRDATDGDYWSDVYAQLRTDPDSITIGSESYISQVEGILNTPLELSDGPQLADTGASDGTDGARLEAGVVTLVQDSSSDWHHVTFDEAIPDAHVVMGPLSFNGGEGAVMRVDNVTDTGFDFQITEWDYLDGAHIEETVSWVAASGGTYTLDDGLTVSVGRVVIEDTNLMPISMGAHHDSESAIFTQVTTYNGNQAVSTRVADQQTDQFIIHLEEEEANDNIHVPENVDWMIFDYGETDSVQSFDAGQVTDHGTTLDINLDATTALLAEVQSENGGDPFALRYEENKTTVDIYIQEEQSANSEIDHFEEDLAVLALSVGGYDLQLA